MGATFEVRQMQFFSPEAAENNTQKLYLLYLCVSH